MFKHLLLLLSLAVPAVAQTTYHYPALETSNVFVGANTFGGSTIFNGLATFNTLPVGTSDLPIGHQFATANAAVTTGSVLAYGAKADWKAGTCTAALASGQNTMIATCNPWAVGDINKVIALNFFSGSTTPWGASPEVAVITGFTDANHITVSKTSSATEANVGFTWGTDFSTAANACVTAMRTQGGGICAIPAGAYLAGPTPYYVLTGAMDDGSYGTPAGAYLTEATGNCTESSGVLTGVCTVTSGGSIYPPNRQVQINFTSGCANTFAPCGFEFALGNTDAGGHVTSITVVYNGFGLTSNPTWTAQPLGGDGAAATATETGGTMNTPTLTAGGGGYAPSSSLDWWAIGGGCTNINFALQGPAYSGNGTVATNSSGAAINSFIITNTPTGCTSAPTIIFGDAACNSGTIGSPVYVQCTNVAPLNPTKVPVNVLLASGVSFQGESGNLGNASVLNGTWDASTVDINQPAMFGGYIANGEDISGVYVNSALWGILGVNNANYAHFDHDTFGAQTGIGFYTEATDIGFSTDHMAYNGYATRINGGNWSHRTDFAAGGGGFYDAQYENNIIARPNAYSAVSSALDDFFANYFWHPEFSAASIDFAETCKFPQSPNQRQTAHVWNFPQQANLGCYRGITTLGMAILARDNRGTGNPSINGLVSKQVNRYIFYGDLGAAQATGWSCEACSALDTDPYRNASSQEANIVINEAGSSFSGAPNAQFNGVLGTIWSVAAQGNPVVASWVNVPLMTPVTNPQLATTDLNVASVVLNVQHNTNSTHPLEFFNYNASGSPNVHTVDLQVISGGLQVKTNATTGGTLTDTFDITTTGVTAQVPIINAAESGQATFIACYTSGGKFGHCATPTSGTPPTCGCVTP